MPHPAGNPQKASKNLSGTAFARVFGRNFRPRRDWMMGISMKMRFAAAATALALTAFIGQAQATTLYGSLTADNAFYAYISTSPTSIGTQVASGNNWQALSQFSTTLAPGQTYYLHIEAINYGLEGGLIGSFTLSDPQFQFANGTQTLTTNTTDFTGSYNSSNNTVSPQTWVDPTGKVTSVGSTSTAAPWSSSAASTLTAAQWIWPSDAQSLPNSPTKYPSDAVCANCTVDFSATISPVPEPLTLSLFGAGLFGLGALHRRRKPGAAKAD